jgi:protein-S-isoprenylcysteine O-methyltransferase Ste14
MAGYFALTVVLPAVRSRRVTGSFGISLFDRRQWATVVMVFSVAGALAWTVVNGAWPSPWWLEAVGWIVVAVGTILTCVAQAQMGGSWRIGIDATHTALVRRGLYGYVRNPIYTGVQLTVLGMVAIVPSWWSILAVAATLVFFAVQARAEERHLIGLHGAEYVEYSSVVGRFVPGIGRLGRR